MQKSLIFLTLTCVLLLLSCAKDESTNTADPTNLIVGKWWCAKPGTGTISGQFFDANGTWQQGSKGGSFNDKGKWSLSSDKKQIVISSVVDSANKPKSGWTYDITSAAENSLLMTWTSFGVKMDMEPCK
jgi:hypothetical protein